MGGVMRAVASVMYGQVWEHQLTTVGTDVVAVSMVMTATVVLSSSSLGKLSAGARLHTAVDQQAGAAQLVEVARRAYIGAAERRKRNSDGT